MMFSVVRPKVTGSRAAPELESGGIFEDSIARFKTPVYRLLALTTLLLTASTPSIADTINQCKDANGSVTFSDRPCPKNSTSMKLNQSVTGGGSESALLDRWAGYCVATFTRDFAIKDVFGDIEHKVAVGSKYLLSHLDYASYWDGIVYPANGGVISYRFKHVEEDLPFTTECNAESTRQVIVVFADTTIFADEGLTKELCRLDAGTVLPDTSFSLDLESRRGVAKLEKEALADRCGGRDKFYIGIGGEKVAGVTQLVSPIAQLLAPR